MRALFVLAFSMVFSFVSQAQDEPIFTLQMCIEKALANNLDIKQQDLSKRQLEINLYQAKMDRWPNLNASASHNYNFGRTIDPFTNAFVNQSIQSNNISINAGVTLYNGLILKNTMLWSQNELDRNIYMQQILENNLALAVADAYLQVVFSEQQLNNAQLQKTGTNAQLKRVRKLVEAGSLNKLEALNLEAQLANDDLNIQNAKANIALAYLTLTQLMQLTDDENYRVVAVDVAEPELTVALDQGEVLERCLMELPEIKNVQEQLESALLREEIAAGGLQPSLSLFANANTLYSESRLERINAQQTIVPIGFTASNEAVFSQIETYDTRRTSFGKQLSDNFGQAVGLRLNVPIFNNYRVKNNMELAEINTDLTEISAERVKNQVRNDVVRAFINYENARTGYITAKKAYEAQNNNFEFAKKRYEAGLLNATDLLLAKNNVQNSETNLNRAKYELIFANTQLNFYRNGSISLN